MNATTHAELVALAQSASPALERSRAAQARRQALSDAKAAIRTHGIRSTAELYGFLACLQEHIERPITDTALKEASDRLLELCMELDDVVNPVLTPEVRGHDKRGEYDAFTQRRSA